MRGIGVAAAAAVLLVSGLLSGPGSADEKPHVPVGVDPGGMAVALIGTGIDYTQPDVAALLARDGEGELIGWDLADGDRRPYARTDGGPGLASEIAGPSRVRLIPVRVGSADADGLITALGLVRLTPARVAVVRLGAAGFEAMAEIHRRGLPPLGLLVIVEGQRLADSELPAYAVSVPEGAGSDGTLLGTLLGSRAARMAQVIACHPALRAAKDGALLRSALSEAVVAQGCQSP